VVGGRGELVGRRGRVHVPGGGFAAGEAMAGVEAAALGGVVGVAHAEDQELRMFLASRKGNGHVRPSADAREAVARAVSEIITTLLSASSVVRFSVVHHDVGVKVSCLF